MKRPVRVVKIGGRAQEDPEVAVAIAELWRAMDGALVVVHGGGAEITRLQRAFSIEPVFIGGRRVTGEDDLELLRMALSGSANKRLVSRLVDAGAHAVGVSGEDAGLLTAVPVDRGRMGFTGCACVARPGLIEHMLRGGFLPVISPVARDRSTGARARPAAALNVNGDDAAAAVAAALGADELTLVSDVSHVRDGESAIASMTTADALSLLQSGAAAGGMAAKLEAAMAAIRDGVAAVRIGDVRTLSDGKSGTTVLASPTAIPGAA